MRLARTLSAATACWALGGCIAVENSRLEIGDDLLLPALQSAPPTAPTADGPSLVGVERTNWAATTFRVPADSVHTSPPYRPLTTYPKVTARQRGTFPNMLTALDGSDEQPSHQTGVGVASSLWALVDLALLVPRMFVRPPYYTIESPRGEFERWPRGATGPAVLPVLGEPEAAPDSTEPEAAPEDRR